MINSKLQNFYINIAFASSNLSYCNRLKVGAVIVKDNNILSFSYNGTPVGCKNNCEDKNNNTKPEVLHAESNAILKCTKNGLSTNNATLFCTHSPCLQCSKLILQAGITSVFYSDIYRHTDGLKLLQKNNIKCKQIRIQL